MNNNVICISTKSLHKVLTKQIKEYLLIKVKGSGKRYNWIGVYNIRGSIYRLICCRI